MIRHGSRHGCRRPGRQANGAHGPPIMVRCGVGRRRRRCAGDPVRRRAPAAARSPGDPCRGRRCRRHRRTGGPPGVRSWSGARPGAPPGRCFAGRRRGKPARGPACRRLAADRGRAGLRSHARRKLAAADAACAARPAGRSTRKAAALPDRCSDRATGRRLVRRRVGGRARVGAWRRSGAGEVHNGRESATAAGWSRPPAPPG